MVQCSWLVCSVLPEYYGVLKGFEEEIMTQKFTGVMNLIAHSVYIHWKEYRKYGWIQTSPTRTSDDIVAPSWSQIYTWQSNDLSSVYCMDEFKISAIEALAAAKSVEGRQKMTILLGDVRRASAAEQELLNAPQWAFLENPRTFEDDIPALSSPPPNVVLPTELIQPDNT